MKRFISILILLVFILTGQVIGQEIAPKNILDSARSRLNQIASYSANATFKVDIDFVNMPDKTAVINFKAPDKIDIESDGFLMVPKVGMKPMSQQLDLENFHTVYLGKELINSDSCFMIKMIPIKRNSKIVLATIWINEEHYLVSRWEVYTKKAGNILIDLFYAGEVLPSRIEFSFELSGMNIPLKYFGNEVEVDKTGLKEAESQNGMVSIDFSNYQIKFY